MSPRPAPRSRASADRAERERTDVAGEDHAPLAAGRLVARAGWSRPRGAGSRNCRCGIGDGGQVALSWAESFGEAAKAAYVAPDGTVEPPVTLAPDTVDPPQIEVAPDGSAAVTFTVEKQDRVVHVSERPVTGGWRTRAIAPAMLPHLSMDGAGRAVLGWSSWREGDETLSFAAGPAFTPAPFVSEGDTALGTLVAGSRGDVLAAWHTNASRGDGFLRAAVARPGAPFSSPALVGRFSAYPLFAALGADGSGAIAAIGGSERRPRPYVRVLRPDGTWGARIKVQDGPAGLAPAGPGRLHARHDAARPLTAATTSCACAPSVDQRMTRLIASCTSVLSITPSNRSLPGPLAVIGVSAPVC